MRKAITIATRRKVWTSFAAIMAVALFCALIVYPNLPSAVPGSSFFNKFFPRLGLDLQGGSHLEYQADLSSIPSADQESALGGVRDVIERRVNAFGVSEPLVQTSGQNRLIVELAGIKDVNEAIKKIGETPLLEFKEQEITGPVALTPEQQAEAKQYNLDQYQKAKEITGRLNNGEDFAVLAKEFSDDPGSKELGGDLGFAKRGTFVPEFEKAIFDDMQVGQITQEPIKSDFGYHIIKKEEVRGEGENLEVKSSHILRLTKDEIYNTDPNSQNQNWINTKLSGKNLKSASVQFDPTTGQPSVNLEFDDEGRELFAEITKRNLQKPVGIFLDGEAISIPTVQDEITQGTAIISGNFNINEAKLLAQRLNAGALPVPIELISQQTVGPSLGKISLQKSLLAGLIGLIVVCLFMLAYYRLFGLIAILALLIYAMISFAIFELWPVTLTLSGIAGFILSIGMAVDANVLIFERSREELMNGKPLATSIEEGFTRAWASILDSNVSSLITCAILAWFGSSLIKGFAISLAIGILVSMFTAVTVSRTFLRLINGRWFSKRLWLFTFKDLVRKEDK
ncbi:MAG: protein translocase subunit SecD [Candidatus Komeilibacteria bacterium]|nr:protein translocase subunit SecD [Candidatus Komeilibacteria bacterium]